MRRIAYITLVLILTGCSPGAWGAATAAMQGMQGRQLVFQQYPTRTQCYRYMTGQVECRSY